MNDPHPEDMARPDEGHPGSSPSDPASRPAPSVPATGDRAVDEAIALVTRAHRDGPAERVEALTEAHRRLQARLTAPPPDQAEARPGPLRR